MSVYLQFLFDDIAEELGQGSGSNRFKAAFPRAVNRALSELELKANTGTDFALIESIDDTVDDLADKYEFVLYAGVAYWLNRMGFRNGDILVTSLPFLYEHIVLGYACAKLGVMWTPLDLRLKPAEIIRSLELLKEKAKMYCHLGKTSAANFGMTDSLTLQHPQPRLND